MSLVRRVSCLAAMILAAGSLTAAAASASTTFFVNGASGNDKNTCTSAGTACKTIPAAVAKVEEDTEGEADTIEVAAGVYQEQVELRNASANGITINGAGSGPGGTEIEGPEKASQATVALAVIGGTAALSNLSIVNDKKENTHEAVEVEEHATLTNVAVAMQQPVKATGIVAAEIGSLTMHGGGVTMEAGSEGPAITAEFVPVAIEGVSILVANGAKGGGILIEGSSGSVSGSVFNIASAEANDPALAATFGAMAFTSDTITDNSAKGPAVEVSLASPLSVNGLDVAMTNPADTNTALEQALGTANYDHVTVHGGWSGPAFGAEGGAITFADSHLAAGSGALTPAMLYFQNAELPGLVIQRSVLEAAPTAPFALEAANANVVLDSSEVLGGEDAIALELLAGKLRQLDVDGSTIDAGQRGIADGGKVTDIALKSTGTNSEWRANVVGSILLEPQSAVVGPKTKAETIRCAYSDVPSQLQAATATEGSIQCASGSEGNTHTEPAALFASPTSEFALAPGTSAIDSVPAGAISLPFGLTPSSTDLAGNPRVVDGNGDCVAVQDKGALELQGHAAACPPAPKPGKPAPPVLSGLTLSPSAFSAASSGATVSRKHKRSAGTKVSYRDSEAATTTFTVLIKTAGRIRGHSCRKPGKHGKHGRRCTLYVALGTFTRTDAAGADSFHFSGRLKGHRLAKGSYRLQAVAGNANGKSTPVTATFTVK